MAVSDPESATPPVGDAAAAAQARAEAARSRAEELRRRIAEALDEKGTLDEGTLEEETGVTAATDEESPAPAATTVASDRTVRLLPAAALGVAALLAVAMLGLTGYLLWQHKAMAEQRHSAAEFAAAARQDVINLMSIDYNTADDSVKRVLDGSTGRFKTNFADTADDFVRALKAEKIITKATVNDAAVESMTNDSAVVLVSATSQREGPQAPKDQQQPRLWRVVVSLEREGDQIKMTGVEFV